METEINSSLIEERPERNSKFPGCFKKSLAFLVDQIIIAVIGVVLLFPFSKLMGSLYLHAWLPGYLIGAIYFVVFESSIFRNQSVGKRIFSMEVKNIENKALSPQASFGRYLLITLPFYNQAISNSVATSIGLTNTAIGGTIFLIIVGILFSGNTVFMLFHPQKRGLHDIIFKSVVVPANSNQFFPVTSFTLKPILSGIVGLAILGGIFGSLFYAVGNNPDFADINALNTKLRQKSAIENLNVTYRTFSNNGKQTMFAIVVHVPINYEKFDDTNYKKELSDKLYPLVKKVNTNPKVDTVNIIFNAQRYIGAFPIYKSQNTSRKMSEI